MKFAPGSDAVRPAGGGGGRGRRQLAQGHEGQGREDEAAAREADEE